MGHDRIGISPPWMGPWRQCLCKRTFLNSAIDEYLVSPAVVPYKQRKFKTLTCVYRFEQSPAKSDVSEVEHKSATWADGQGWRGCCEPATGQADPGRRTRGRKGKSIHPGKVQSGHVNNILHKQHIMQTYFANSILRKQHISQRTYYANNIFRKQHIMQTKILRKQHISQRTY